MTTIALTSPVNFLLERYHAVHPRVRYHGLVLAWLQVADGILTGIALSKFGIEAEGNLLLYKLMTNMGWVQGLVIAKLAGIVLISFLCAYAEKVRWISPALPLVIVFYLFGAVLPWVEALS